MRNLLFLALFVASMSLSSCGFMNTCKEKAFDYLEWPYDKYEPEENPDINEE